MGCFHAKCCSLYPATSDDDTKHGIANGSNEIPSPPSPNPLEMVSVPSHNFHLEYSTLTKRGYYPETPDKENQDCFCVVTQLQGNPNLHLFGVFDGHGLFGTECSNFVKNRLVEILSSDPTLSVDPLKAYNSAFSTVSNDLHESEIDDSLSGTTAITVLVSGDTLFVANVGDSRAVIAVNSGGSTSSVLAEDLSKDQTPFRKDEYERVKLCGARVLTIDQVEGLQDQNIQAWGDNESECGDPPRLWVQDGLYPGTAFTRSVGDSIAEKIGVIAIPEISTIQLRPSHLFFVVASDGVFEFLSSQAVVDTVMKYTDSRDACAAIAGESYRLWLEHENRTDDITVIIVHIKDLHNAGVNTTDGTNEFNVKHASSELSCGFGKVLSTVMTACQSLGRNLYKLLCPQIHVPYDQTPVGVDPVHPNPKRLQGNS